jgi:hypothetical protein
MAAKDLSIVKTDNLLTAFTHSLSRTRLTDNSDRGILAPLDYAAPTNRARLL